MFFVLNGRNRLDDARYLHWDKLRFVKPIPPEFNSHEEWWHALAIQRRASCTRLSLETEVGAPFTYCFTSEIARRIRKITLQAGGRLDALAPIAGEMDRNAYLFSTLIEESITSSQLEGAVTTRLVAKEMLRTKRPPVDKSERMIFNNYQAMEFAREMRDERLTPEIIFELHRILGKGALDVPNAAGRFRRPEERIAVVAAFEGEIIHDPPPAGTLPERLDALCEFANGAGPYVDPLIRAMILHFMVGYDHPFVDGNGRVARALFYWCALANDLDLLEFTSISRILLRAPTRYTRAYLLTETAGGDLTYFILHQLDVIDRSLEELKTYLRRKTDERQAVERALAVLPLNHRQQALIREMAAMPWEPHTYQTHMARFGVSRMTAFKDFKCLMDLGIVRREPGGKAAHYWPVTNLASALVTARNEHVH